ncbi:hypothetical protein CMV_026883 [Castanea mollissima]|uniref:Uncharacterized protein n=1 Tax=Castanea mollissima TaxID=60419 RepID=A0A8J4V3B9_9ROSI|nr:hypothetical protein CMV_026883 [Castanea mollissima]
MKGSTGAPLLVVAYCSAGGTVLRFQLTSKVVDKVFSRNRTPHFLCGSLTEEESAITINTPLPNAPFLSKNSLNKSGDIPLSMREIISEAQQPFVMAMTLVQNLDLRKH